MEIFQEMDIFLSNLALSRVVPLKIQTPRGGMHAFRRGRVSLMQQHNVPPDFTKNQVGHSGLGTTSGYAHFPTHSRGILWSN